MTVLRLFEASLGHEFYCRYLAVDFRIGAKVLDFAHPDT